MERLVDYDKFIKDYGVLSNHEDDYRLLCAAKITAYTKDEVVAMLEELLLETEKLDCEMGHDFGDYYNVVAACQKCIQQKIIALKGETL